MWNIFEFWTSWTRQGSTTQTRSKNWMMHRSTSKSHGWSKITMTSNSMEWLPSLIVWWFQNLVGFPSQPSKSWVKCFKYLLSRTPRATSVARKCLYSSPTSVNMKVTMMTNTIMVIMVIMAVNAIPMASACATILTIPHRWQWTPRFPPASNHRPKVMSSRTIQPSRIL